MTNTEVYDYLLDRPGLDSTMLKLAQEVLAAEEIFLKYANAGSNFRKWYQSVGITDTQAEQLLAAAQTVRLLEAGNG
jgi:hypothetical protein